MRGGAEGRRDVLAAVVDSVGVARRGQRADAVRAVGTAAERLVVHPAGDAATRGGRPGLAVVVGVAGRRADPGQLRLEGATGRVVGEQDRVEAGGAPDRAALGGVGGDVRPGGRGRRDAVVEVDLEGGLVGLVERGTGLPAGADGGLSGVVGVLERRRRLVGAEAGRGRGAGRRIGGLVHDRGLGGVAVPERSEGDDTDGEVTGRRREHDELGVRARGGGAEDGAGGVEHVDVEVGGGVGPRDVDLELVTGAVARGRAHVQREVVARGGCTAVGRVQRVAADVGSDERTALPLSRASGVRDRTLGRCAGPAGGGDADDSG